MALSPTKRGRPRSEDIDGAVMAAAISLFEENGYKATSLEAIAAKAGIGRPTLYRRWPNKAALAAAVYETLVPMPDLPPAGFRQRLRALTRHVFAAYRSSPAAAILAGLVVEGQADESSRDAFEAHYFTPRRAMIVRLFQQASAHGERATEADPELLVDAYVGAIWVRVLTRSGGLTDQDADALSDLFSKGTAMTVTQGTWPGAIGRVTEMHAVYYAHEWGLDTRFETQVAEGLSEFVPRYQEGRDLMLRAEKNGQVIGTITIDGAYPGAPEGEAVLRWFNVDASARGQGLGRQLMDAAMTFIEEVGYKSVTLTTFKGLEAATSLYLDYGFQLTEERQGDLIYGNPVTGQTYRWTRPINS